jgi:glycosyltransferase involved in cell wall biosynthesis
MPLRIGLDARMVGPVMSGLGRYARALATHLPPLDPDNRYVVIRRAHAPAPLGTAPNVEDAVVEGDIDQPANLFAARAIGRLGLDLYHSLYDFVPPGLAVPRIVLTLHDLTWLEQPDLCFDERFAWLKARVTTAYAWATMPYAARRAARIIAVSAHTRDRAVAVLGVDPARLRVVHHGVDRREFPPADGEPDGDPFFLCLGNTKPYKNTRAAIQGFALLAPDDRRCRLRVTGRGDSARNLGRLAARLGVGDRVAFTGPVPHGLLLELLHGARALVFPSLVEGFGLPLLEAMSAGCPVIGSTVPTVQEICGDAALLVDPHSPDAIAGAMRCLLDDDGARRNLRSRGLARADMFDWRTCAERTLTVYREVLAGATDTTSGM